MNEIRHDRRAISLDFNWMQVAVMGMLSAVYMATMHPSLPGGDAGELIVAANELGVAHPPGYPLYMLMLKAFFLLVPYGSVAWKANLLTILISAAAGGFHFQAVFRITGSTAAGLLAAGLFGFSRLTWIWSVTAEVFALNNLLVAVLLLVAVNFSSCAASNKIKVSQLGAFVSGLCLTNQHTTVIYIIVLVSWVIPSLYKHKLLSTTLLMKLSVCFLLGLLPYAYLPLSSMSGLARWTWGDQSTVRGFFTHLLRREYGTLQLLKDHEGQGVFQGLFAYVVHVVKDLTLAVLFFFLITTVSVYKRLSGDVELLSSHAQKRQSGHIVTVMVIMLSTYSIFFAWRANLNIMKPFYKSIIERFWLQSDLILVALAGVAFDDVVSVVNRVVPLVKYRIDLVVAVILISLQLVLNVSISDQHNKAAVEDYALSNLHAFPSGAIVLTKGDLPSNSFRYYHLSEGVRPDIVLFDQEVLTYEWSIPMLGHHYPGLIFPGNRMALKNGINVQGQRLFTFKSLLDANYEHRPIFGCVGVQDHEPSWKAAYDLWPFGICVQFVKKGSKVKLKEWLNASRHFAGHCTHPVPAEESTWEDIASGEMWRVKTVAGFHLLQISDEATNKEEKATLLRLAYQIYQEAMESNPHFPSYWHKNFALVCEKLRHVISDLSESVLLIRKTIAHFKAYLDSGPTDPQTAAIEKAIGQLQQYYNSMTHSGTR